MLKPDITSLVRRRGGVGGGHARSAPDQGVLLGKVLPDAIRTALAPETGLLDSPEGGRRVGQDADVQHDFWNALVRVHLQRQLESPENDLWDILMASDRIAGFLPPETRREYTEWLFLYDQMYVGAAAELGYEFDDVGKFVRVVVKVLDTANEWCRWDGTKKDLHRCVEQAIAISRALLSVNLGS